MDRDRSKERDVRDKPDDPGRRRDMEDPVVRRCVRRVHARDREPLRLLVSRIRDREVFEPDSEERMVEEHLESRLIEKDAVAQSDPSTDVEQTGAEGRRDEHDDERHERDCAGDREPKKHLPR
jgi:hypothetical protein